MLRHTPARWMPECTLGAQKGQNPETGWFAKATIAAGEGIGKTGRYLAG
jgi:hypothetical protein